MMRGTFGNWRCTFKPSLSFLFLILIRWAQTYMLHLSDLRTGSKARFPCMRVFSHRDLTRDCCTWVHARSPFHVCDICAIYQLIGVSRVRTAGAASNSFLLATAFYSRATAFFQQQQPTAFSCVKALVIWGQSPNGVKAHASQRHNSCAVKKSVCVLCLCLCPKHVYAWVNECSTPDLTQKLVGNPPGIPMVTS